MKTPPQYRLRLEDGRNEPIPDLEDASRIILIDRANAGAEDITFGYSLYQPHTGVHRKHVHTEAEEIMYILSGRGIGGVNDQETELAAGDTLWVPRGAEHWFSNPFDTPCAFLFIYTRSSLQAAGYRVTADPSV